MTLHATLENGAEAFPDRCWLRFEDASWSYAQGHAVADKIARGLVALGIRPGDRVGLLFAITHTLFKRGMIIHLARISTNADQALDVFYISDASGRKVVELESMRRLRAALVERLDHVPAHNGAA